MKRKASNPSEAYEQGRKDLRAAAARLGTTNLSPSTVQREDWRHAWAEYMRGWKAAKKERNPCGKKNPPYSMEPYQVKRAGAKAAERVMRSSGADSRAVRTAEKAAILGQYRIAVESGDVPRGMQAAWVSGWKSLGKNPAKRNPPEAVMEGYEKFHGHKASALVEVSEKVHFHKYLWAMGDLVKLVVLGVDGYEHSITGFGKALLCSNELPKAEQEKGRLGNQMFIRGGDQAVNLADFGIKGPHIHEVETLGAITRIEYFTRKDHLGEDGGKAIYFHKTGDEGKKRRDASGSVVYRGGWPPDLIYKVRDKHLEISGGSYTITPEGIVN